MRITSIRTTSILGDLQYWSYGYTPAGDIEEIHNIITDVTYDYTYDELHRLLSETSDGAYPTINYTYNAIGNIMSKTYGINSYAYTYDTTRKHAVANINFNGNNYAYTYDGNGNMTAGPDFTDPTQTATRAISYNADNLPTNIAWTKAATVTSAFTYDGSGTRVKKAIQGGSTTWYIGSHYEKKDSTYTKYIFAGGTRIAKVTTSGYHILHGDHLGSSTVITESSGGVVESTEYNPFGTTRTHSGATLTNYKYTDQERDPETGLYNYGARYYDPMIGRFISPDSIVQAPFNPQSLNRYSYCINSPLMYVDPSGNIFGIDDWIIGGIIFGAVFAGIQSDWSFGAMLIGGIVGGISSGIYSNVCDWATGGLVGAIVGTTEAGLAANAGLLLMAELGGVMAGGAAAGATTGLLYAAAYGGNIYESIVNGAAYGAVTAAAIWGAGKAYGWATTPATSVAEDTFAYKLYADSGQIGADAQYKNMDELKLYDTGVWTGNESVNAELGQIVEITTKNVNVFGTTIEISSNWGQTQQMILFPGRTETFRFSVFGQEPISWRFSISTKSKAFVVKYDIKSTWVPGM